MKLAISIITALTCFAGSLALAQTKSGPAPEKCTVSAYKYTSAPQILKPEVINSDDDTSFEQTRFVYSSKENGTVFLMFFRDGTSKVEVHSYGSEREPIQSFTSFVESQKIDVSIQLLEREWNVHCR